MHLLVLPGDGIGPEITAATLAVLRVVSERFDLRLRIEEAAVGHAGLRAHGSTIHADIVEKARRAEGIVLGPTSTLEFKDPARGELNPSMMLRKSLDLFANIRPARTYRASRCAAASLTSWWRAKTPKVSMPTATWRRGAAR
jgi:3-isopropylmalate dehydrogenase